MWSNHRMNWVHSNQTRWLFSTRQRCQATMSEKWCHYHPLHCLGHKLLQLTLIRMNQLCHMDLDGSYLIFLQTWTIRICRPILPTMVVANPTAERHDRGYSHQTPEPSETSSISTPLMNLSTIEGWHTPHMTTDDNTFYSNDESRRFFFLPSSLSPPPPPWKLKRKLSLGMSFSKRGRVSQHLCEACGRSLLDTKDMPGSS